MTIDIHTLADRLSGDASVSDHEFWKALARVDAELERHRLEGTPVPIRLLRHRRIIREARLSRRSG